jgi:hypothetical protein
LVEICAYYYPGWHDRPNASLSEWDLVCWARPYFEGHYQPRIPLDGYYDDTRHSTVAAQAALASRYGIDAFIFLWYWKRGRIELEEPLTRFVRLKSAVRFSLMWCWKMPRPELPAVPGREAELEHNRWVETDTDDFRRMIDECCERYFSHPGYRTLDGRPILLLYSVEGFRAQLGEEQLREMLRAGRLGARERGFPGLYLVGVTKSTVDVRGLGFDALTGYNSILDPTENGPHLKDYGDLVPRRVRAWRDMARCNALPYVPSVSLGWDASPRGARVESLSPELDFPWVPIVVRSTPERFGEFLHAAYDWVGGAGQLPFIHLCAWNEWSEGAHLEPDRKHGHSYLSMVRDVRRARDRPGARALPVVSPAEDKRAQVRPGPSAEVTVLVATFNRAHCLAQSLDSLLAQTLPPGQIIVIDDGSTDATADVLARYRGRIEVVTQANGGKSSALNRAMPLAKGEYVWIFDDDDIALPHAAERHARVLAAYPEVDFTYGTGFVVDAGDDGVHRSHRLKKLPEFEQNGERDETLPRLLELNFMPQQAVLVRRRCYQEVGPFDESLPVSHDYEMMLRLTRRFAYRRVEDPTFIFVQHRACAARQKTVTVAPSGSCVGCWTTGGW